MNNIRLRIANARIPGTDRLIDVDAVNGRIVAISPAQPNHTGGRAAAAAADFGAHAAAAHAADAAAYAAASARTTDVHVTDAAGRWIIPGLWDCHTHFTQWAQTLGRLDLIAARSAHEAMDMLRDRLARLRARPQGLSPDVFVVGMRFRHSLWSDCDQPTLAAIDEAAGDQPVALSSADMHCGWVNTAAAQRLGVQVRDSGLIGEREWFDAYCKLDNAPGAARETLRLIRAAQMDAARKGVIGIRDYEMADNIAVWTRRFASATIPVGAGAGVGAGAHAGGGLPSAVAQTLTAAERAELNTESRQAVAAGFDWDASFAHGMRGLRVDAGIYPERLADAIDAGWHTGDELPGSRALDGAPGGALGRVGAMKLISDGSLNTRSAYCSTPYSGIRPNSFGTLNYTPDQIEQYFHLATVHGFDIACHAIGDEANTIVLNAAEATGAHGSIEHAQMLKPVDIPRFARIGLDASVQPQHAMDDRDVIARFWANPAGIPYPFRSLYDAGARLRFGSDAPVAPLDPWMAISAAVFGTESSAREPFQPEQCLDVRVALAASTAAGRDQLVPGAAADLVLLDADPYAADSPEAMRAMKDAVAATMLAGRWTYRRF